MIGLARRRVMGGKNSGGELPAGYTELEYVYNNQGAYIDTGIAVTGDMAFNVNIRPNYLSNNYTGLFGGGENPSQTRNSVGLKTSGLGGNLVFIYRTSINSGYVVSTDTFYNVELKDDGCYIDGQLYSSITRTTFTSTRHVFIGTYNQSGTPAASDVYLGIHIINGNKYIPCTNGTDVGFYDVANSTFKTSDSEISFVAGPVKS